MASLRLFFLGDPTVVLNGRSIALKPRKALALLAYLSVSSRRHSRDALAELLFPRFGRDRALAGVRQCLSALRRSLGGQLVQSDGTSVWLNPDGLWVDVKEAETPASSMDGFRERGELFRGDFLSGFFLKDAPGFDSWQRSVEESCRTAQVTLLKRLAGEQLAAHDLEATITTASRLLDLDHVDEAAHRLLMDAYALSGRRADALRQYERCREALQTELGAAPGREMEELRFRIAAGAVLSPEASPVESPPHNLRPSLTTFIGREADLNAVTQAILRPGLRLLTITGSAGTGKTRLAREAAARMLRHFSNGVFFIDLVPLRQPDDLLIAIAAALDIQDLPRGREPLLSCLRVSLRTRKMLLVLDNFEHIVDSVGLLAELMAACLNLTVLATSRQPLKLQAENEYLLAPLPIDDAVKLFAERARASRHDFELTQSNAESVNRLCVRLDGLPLAIELAAGRTRFLSPDKLLSLLETRGSQLLSGGSTDMPARHQALWRAIDWSYALLSPSEKALFQRLAAFPGGFSLEGAERVCAVRAEDDILANLQSLVEKNLASQTVRGGEPWYAMCVPIREFAEQQLESAGERQEVLRRRSDYYRFLTEQAERDIDRPPGARWADTLERELPNILAAVDWSLGDSLEAALRILTALERFMGIRGHSRDSHDLLQRALSAARMVSGIERLRAKATISAANDILVAPLASEAVALAEEGVALWRASGDASGLAHGLVVLGVARFYGARAPAEVLLVLEESVSLCRATNDQMGLSHAMFFLALATYIQGDTKATKLLVEEEYQLARRLGDLSRLAGTVALRGLLAADSEDYAAAQRFFDEGQQVVSRTPDTAGRYYLHCCQGGLAFLKDDFSRSRSAFQQAAEEGILCLEYSQPIEKVSLGLVSLREGMHEESRDWFRGGVELLRNADNNWGRQNLCACLAGMAGLRSAEGCPALAARILEAVRPVLTAPYPRLAWGHDFSLTPRLIAAEFARISSEVQSALGPDAERAFAEGRGLSLEAAAELALAPPAP